MRFTFSPEQQQFAASIHDLLTGADTPAAVRAWEQGRHEPGTKIWQALADLGVPALLVPERFGGLGAGLADVVVAFEVLGYHCVPGPVVESAVVVPVLLDGQAAEEWLPRLAAGESVATVAAPAHVPYALDADVADLVLHAGEQVSHARVGQSVASIDRARRLFQVEPGRAVAAGSVERALDLGTLAVAAQLVGLGRWLLDASVAYAKQRHQYGRPIGQYQAVKHLLADAVTRLELARPLLHGAAVSGSRRDISAAKAEAGQAAYQAARAALQVHGAIGYTAEHDLGLYLTKVRALLGVWGDGGFHRRRVLEEL